MSTGTAVGAAICFVWLGMVLAISFIETPLKFRAPDVTLRIGLGIGRLVFRALNSVELVLAAAVVVTMLVDHPSSGAGIAAAVAILALLAQVAVVRPRLGRRTNQVLGSRSDEDAPRSRVHYAYVALELVKVVALIVAGSVLLSG